MTRKKIIAVVLLCLSALIWAVPAAIYAMLLRYQFAQGNGSFVLILFGPAEYGLGFLLSVAVPILLLRRRNDNAAIAVSASSLTLGVILAVPGILALGST